MLVDKSSSPTYANYHEIWSQLRFRRASNDSSFLVPSTFAVWHTDMNYPSSRIKTCLLKHILRGKLGTGKQTHVRRGSRAIYFSTSCTSFDIFVHFPLPCLFLKYQVGGWRVTSGDLCQEVPVGLTVWVAIQIFRRRSGPRGINEPSWAKKNAVPNAVNSKTPTFLLSQAEIRFGWFFWGPW